MNAPGIYTITYSAVDSHGNTSTNSRTVTVRDTTPPQITCAANLALCTSSNSAVATFTITATDTCAASAPVTCAPASGSAFPLGTNTVVCVANDGNGNTNTCSFKVVVSHATAPVMRNLNYSGGHFSFTFQSENPCRYVVEYKNSITDAGWTALTSVTGDGTAKTVTDNSPAPVTRFYRIRVE